MSVIFCAILGLVVGLGINFVSCVLCIASCGEYASFDKFPSKFYIICVLIGGIIGIYFEICMKKEEVAQKKEEEYEAWENNLSGALSQIERCISDYNSKSLFEDVSAYYDYIWELQEEAIRKNIPEYDYTETFNEILKKHKNYLRNAIYNNLLKIKGPYTTGIALKATYLLKAAERNDSQFNEIISSVKEFYDYSYYDSYIFQSEAYGNCILDFGNLEIHDDEEAQQILDNISYKKSAMFKNDGLYYKETAKKLNKYFLCEIAAVLWYYAKRIPLDAAKFENVKDIYNFYTEFNSEYSEKVEVVLADIYAKKQLGGIELVKRDIKFLNQWFVNKIEHKWYKTVKMFVSGLAWMELYELERDFLRQFVTININLLDGEMQERLKFLEDNGTYNIKIYDVESTENFVFDSTSLEWDKKELGIFFRKISMKNDIPKYSLALNKWTKTLPLASGQKVSKDEIYNEFQTMIQDFDGEVICKKTFAKAVNLENMEYEDAVLFEFKSKRNRCVSMLFSSDKYGRNLNLSILTLFTPDESLSVEEMRKYAFAVDDNIYVDSFRESILQAIDVVLKEDKDVYDDEQVVNKDIFE